MSGHRTIVGLGATAAAALLAAVAAAQPPLPVQSPPPAPSLAGTWTLNASLSEPPKGGGEDGGRGGGAGGMGRHGGMRLGGEGMGGRPGGMGGRGGGGFGGGMRPPGAERPDGERGAGRRGLLGGATPIRIVVDYDDVRIISGDGHVRTITANGKAVERTRGFATLQETAQWRDGGLVVTSSAPDGTLVTETFAATDDGSGRLVQNVQVRRADSDRARTARWVYDRDTQGAFGAAR